MTPLEVIDIGRDGLWTLIVVAAPLMAVALVVGLIIALFQALTQIQEMTLTFVPKILAMFFTLMAVLPFMYTTLSDYTERLTERIVYESDGSEGESRMEVPYLEQFVVGEVWAFIMIFVRMGAGIMILPGFGEGYVSPRVRLLFALMTALVLTPVFGNAMPTIPGSPITLGIYVLAEAITGIFMGLMVRFIVAVLHVAGTLISFQSALALATVFDNSQGGQTTIIGNFMTIASVVLFFTLDLHHLMLMGLADSYTLFIPGQFPIVGDFANASARLFQDVFTLGVQLAAPHIVISLIFYLGSGILARLMPTFQVFFVLIPPQILISFFLLFALFSTIMLTYVGFAEEILLGFLDRPGL